MREEREKENRLSLSLLRTTIPTLPASACEWRADRCELRVCSDGVDICNYITGELRKIYTTIITTTTTPRTLKVSRKLCHFWLFALTRSSPTRGDKKGDRITINISPENFSMGTPTRSPGVCLHQSRYGNSADPARRVMMERTFHSVLGWSCPKVMKMDKLNTGAENDGCPGWMSANQKDNTRSYVHTLGEIRPFKD